MRLIAAITLTVFVAGCEDAYAASPYDVAYQTKTGVTLASGHAILTGTNGMTLYTSIHSIKTAAGYQPAIADVPTAGRHTS
jgi:predicted lipoprotein with Yx(FWY)xxD motif